MKLSEGNAQAKDIIDFLYSHKMFRQMAYWLIAHKYTGDNLIAYFAEGHNLSLLSLIKEVTKYQLKMEGEIYDHHFKPGLPIAKGGLPGGSNQR